MKKQLWSGIIAATACTFAISLSAQTASQAPPQAPRSSASGSADKITVTGCVEKESSSATPGATGTSGSTSPSSAGFVLNVKPDASSASSATAGTSGSASSYRLDADDSKLSSHVGHKVEITGTLDKAMSGSTAPAGSTSTASSSAPKLKVDSVKMIAASCEK